MWLNNMAMRDVVLEKVSINIGVGERGERLEKAKSLIEKITKKKPIETKAKKRNPVFKLQEGLPIGVKVTLRKNEAKEFLLKALKARKFKLSENCFDKFGNFAFGIHEYIDFPGVKYDADIGMFGFDVCVSLTRKGRRVEKRRIKKSSIGKKHRLTKEDGIEFAKSLGVSVKSL